MAAAGNPDGMRVIFDVAVEEKAALTVDDLLHKFYSLRGEEFISDRMLLA